MLRLMVWRLYYLVFCTVAVSSNDILYVASRTDMTNVFINGVFTCSTFDSRLLGFVSTCSILIRFRAAEPIVRLSLLVAVSALTLRQSGHTSLFFCIYIRYVRGVCRLVNRGSVWHAVTVDCGGIRGSRYSPEVVEAACYKLIICSCCNVVGNSEVHFRQMRSSNIDRNIWMKGLCFASATFVVQFGLLLRFFQDRHSLWYVEFGLELQAVVAGRALMFR